MSENVNTAKSKSFLKWEDWLVVLTGGMVSSGAIGWLVYRDFKSQQFDLKGIMTIAASFVAGLGLYFTGSAFIYMWENSNDREERRITSLQDASYLDALDRGVNICEKFANLIIELERKFMEFSRTRESKGFEESLMNIYNIQRASEVPVMAENATNRQSDSNRKELRNGLQLPTANNMETCSNESIENRNARFKEEILSYISELKCCMQGAIDALPSAKHIRFLSTETSNEMHRLVVMIIKEYANSMLPKFEQSIDEFVDCICKTMDAIKYNKEHKNTYPIEILVGSEDGLSLTPRKIEMNDQYYKASENGIKFASQEPPYQNDQRSTNALEACIESPKPMSIPSLHEENTFVKDPSLSVMTQLASPSSTSISHTSKEANRPGLLAVKNPLKPPVKLTLTQEQMNNLNILRSELLPHGFSI